MIFELPFALAMIAGACDPHRSPTSPADTRASHRIAVLGDSLAVSPSRAASFPAVLQERLVAEGWPWTVSNAGVNGDTTADGVRRLDAVLADEPRILVVALGGNDGLRGVDTSVVTRNLAEMITRAKAQGVRVLLCGMEAPPLHGFSTGPKTPEGIERIRAHG